MNAGTSDQRTWYSVPGTEYPALPTATGTYRAVRTDRDNQREYGDRYHGLGYPPHMRRSITRLSKGL